MLVFPLITKIQLIEATKQNKKKHALEKWTTVAFQRILLCLYWKVLGFMLTNVNNVNYLYRVEVARTQPGHRITHCNSSPSLNSLKCNQGRQKGWKNSHRVKPTWISHELINQSINQPLINSWVNRPGAGLKALG